MKLVSALVDIIATADEPDLTLQTHRGTIRHVNVKQFTKKHPRKFIRVSAPVQNLEGASTHLDSPPTNQNNSTNENIEQESINQVENGGNDDDPGDTYRIVENLQDDSQLGEPPATADKQLEEFVPEKVKQTSQPKIN